MKVQPEDLEWAPTGPGMIAHAGPEHRRQPTPRKPRWAVSLRALIVVLAMAAAALGVLWLESAAVQEASQMPSGGALTIPPPGTGSPSSDAAAPQPPDQSSVGEQESKPGRGLLVVHVAGAVSHPGVFTLPTGSRVYQAIDAAGGALPEAALSALNLAAPLTDGLQVLVPTAEQASAGSLPQGQGAAAAGAPGGVGGRVNINSATAADFEALPGIGPVLAARIVAWREQHGPFPSVEGLSAVSGIGPKLLEGLRDQVVVP